MDNKQKHILYWFIVLVVIIIGYTQYNPGKPVGIVHVDSAIQNFEDCAAAGNPVMESYPRKCRANDKTFVEEIDEPIDDALVDDRPDDEPVEGPCRDEDAGCTPFGPPCCEGLRAVSDASEIEGGCAAVTCGSICRPCGNGVCDDNENKCSCPEDCGKVDYTCPAETRGAQFCIAEYLPVCGYTSEGTQIQTYSNSCNACKNSEVDYFQEGEC